MGFVEFFVSFVDWLASLGYFGIFLGSFITNATVIFPTPFHIAVFLVAPQMNPIILGIVAGFGAALGELVGYLIGYHGKRILPEKQEKQLKGIGEKFHKYGGVLVLTVFAATPLPDDVVGIFCGMVHYPRKKFFLAMLLGKTIMFTTIALAGFYSLDWILGWFGLL